MWVSVDLARLAGRSSDGPMGLVPTSRGDMRERLRDRGVHIESSSDTCDIGATESMLVLSWGSPSFEPGEAANLAASQGAARAWCLLFEQSGDDANLRVRNDYAVACIDLRGAKVLLATDRFGRRPICYTFRGGALHFSDRADDLAESDSRLDNQSLFDYLYFHVIPAPKTAFEGIHRLPAAHRMVVTPDGHDETCYWQPKFETGRRARFEDLREEFRGLLDDAVVTQARGQNVGAFLSGGTDSSTVAGVMARVNKHPPPTFSIGFDSKGYDELEYARLAARHFGTDHHEFYLTPEHLVDSIETVAAHYDQPFGNSSALPAYYCARLARAEGVDRLLAGDGGDEIFGGNSRYAMQKIFNMYGFAPEWLRRRVIEPAFAGQGLLGSLPLTRKVSSYVRQAAQPMPDRLQSYNLLLRLGLDTVLTPEFLRTVDPQEPLRIERQIYNSSDTTSSLSRTLVYDWKYTLSDNDLPKVVGTTALAGISVGFPFLDDRLVDFSLRIPDDYKVRGMTLRWFFKRALRGFLPDAIIAKKKHGFGLPFGPWMTKHSALRALATDSLIAFSNRGIVRREFVDDLLNHRLAEHPGYYGEMVWILMMLEQWLGRSASRTTGRAR